ncbi:MAG TPA: hypothetical protein VGK67_29990 [Myxococcales bacterium]|jgi:hypothetical protein
MRPKRLAHSTPGLLRRALLVVALLALLPAIAEGAARKKAKPKAPVEPAPAPVEKRVALIAPEDTKKTEAVVTRVLEAAEQDLVQAGYQVVALPKVAAEYRKRYEAVPYCRDTPACLAKVGRRMNTGFVIGAVAVTNAGGVDIELTIVEAASEAIVARTALLGVPWSGSLPDLPRPATALQRFVPGGAPVKLDPAADRTGPVAPPPPALDSQPAKNPDVVEPARATEPKKAGPEPKVATTEKPPEPGEGKPAEPKPAAPPGPTNELLGQARAAYEALEFDKAATLASRVLATPGLDSETRLDAYLVQASSLAIAADTQASEVSFRLLLRARPDFELPRSTPPKILGVFKKVKAEENAIADQVRSVARKRLVEGLKLVGEPPSKAVGGRPLPFSFRLRDPTSAVTIFDVPYRRHGDGGYSVLALQRDPEGAWKGTIPAEWTASESGFELEYYLSAHDEAGPLVGRGEAASPLRLAVSPGQVEHALPKPVPRWALYVLSAGAVASAAAAGGLGVATLQAQTNYDRYAAQSVNKAADGRPLVAMGANGRALSDAALGMAVATGVLLTAALACWPFTEPAPTGSEAP